MSESKKNYAFELDQLAKQVRQEYFYARRLYAIRIDQSVDMDANKTYSYWDGGRDSRGVNHQPIWPRIVKNATKHNLHPLNLVKAVFAIREGGPAPTPNMIASRTAIEEYERYLKIFHTDIEYEFRAFQEAAKKEVWKLKQILPTGDKQVWRMAIASPTLSCSALYRYILAVSVNQYDLAESCRQSAELDYLQYPDDYDRVLADYLPEDFRRNARRLREKLANY
jgi:hypothetical protein